MSPAAVQPFSPVELAWIRSQSPANLSVTTVAIVSQGALDQACVKSRIEDRLLSEERLRQRMGHSHLPLSRPRWQEHPDFQLSDHFFQHDLSGQTEATSLAELVGQLSSQPLDENLPLWQIHLVDLQGERSALVLRLHAAVADSSAAAAMALRLVDTEDPPALTELGLEHLQPVQPLRDRGSLAAAATRMLSQLITARADRKNPFRREPNGIKSMHWSAPTDLEEIRSRASQTGISVSEALMSAVVGALRRAVQRHDTPAEDIDMRAVVSIDLRQPDDPFVGTRSALGLLRLPLRAPSIAERAAAVHDELVHFSHAPEHLAVLGCETGPGLTMTEIEERSLRLLSQKASISWPSWTDREIDRSSAANPSPSSCGGPP